MSKDKREKMSRRKFVNDDAAGTSAKAYRRATASRPNVIFILGDDLGWGDLSCYGRPDYRTPNLDALARQGVRFTQGYSASPVCTPTRCAFLTGRYPARTPIGLEEPLTWKKMLEAQKRDVGLEPSQPTIASLLRDSGYRTGLVGKWHLGYLPKYGPVKSGFEEFFGMMSGGSDYFTHREAFGEADLFEMEAPVERIGYTTELLTERAIDFISRRDERPFYLSLHHTAPHWPWEGPDDEAASRPPKLGLPAMTNGGSLEIYASMMKSLDDGVGRVMKALRSAKLDRNTLVIFTSDNGGESYSYQWPFTGQKFSLFEGGIRVPAIVRWPGVVPANRTTEQVAITMDWTATILAAAGAQADPDYPLDGEDLLPVIRGERAPYERTIFWRNEGQGAVRKGNWKYMTSAPPDGGERLFDLAFDVREQARFGMLYPEQLAGLREEYRKWEAQMLPLPVAEAVAVEGALSMRAE
jgi:arylsulfatase A-like enzyme